MHTAARCSRHVANYFNLSIKPHNDSQKVVKEQHMSVLSCSEVQFSTFTFDNTGSLSTHKNGQNLSNQQLLCITQ